MQLNAFSGSISFDIQGLEKIPWSPTPKAILESNEFLDLDKLLFGLIGWAVSPNAAMVKEGFVEFSYSKGKKVNEITQKIQSLVPGSQTGLNQIPVSITM